MSESGGGHGVWGIGLRYQNVYLVGGHGDRTIDRIRPFDDAADVSGCRAAVLISLAVPARAAGFSFSLQGLRRSASGDACTPTGSTPAFQSSCPFTPAVAPNSPQTQVRLVSYS